MSTRSTITVRDTENASEAYSIYRHSDGYPDTEHGVIATLTAALPYAWKLPRFEADDFAAAIIAAWKKPADPASAYPMQGGNIRMTTGRDAHGDTEFHYEVFRNAKGRVVVRTFAAKYDNAESFDHTWVRVGRDRVIG